MMVGLPLWIASKTCPGLEGNIGVSFGDRQQEGDERYEDILLDCLDRHVEYIGTGLDISSEGLLFLSV